MYTTPNEHQSPLPFDARSITIILGEVYCICTSNARLPADLRDFEILRKDDGGVRPLYDTLYHLALTCRAFRELALDALWAHIQTPDMLVMCLSQDARSQPVKLTRRDRVMSAIFGHNVMLLRPLVDDDWTSFQKLHDSAALALLDSHASPSLPFPLVRELYWYDKRDVLLPCLQRCISTTLTRLLIHSELWPSAMVDLVAGLGKACPKIKEFLCSMPPASTCAMLSGLVACWDDLEILETGAHRHCSASHP